MEFLLTRPILIDILHMEDQVAISHFPVLINHRYWFVANNELVSKYYMGNKNLRP